MKLSKVPVIEVVENVRRPYFIAGSDVSRGQKLWKTETEVTKLYDFGPDTRGHEAHVQMRPSEFSCDAHEKFDPKCEACNQAAKLPLAQLLESRGIEVEAA